MRRVRRGIDDKWYDGEGKLLDPPPTMEEIAAEYPGSAASIELIHHKLDLLKRLLISIGGQAPDC